MNVLFIGGTGNISSAVSQMAVDEGIDLFHLNRGEKKVHIPNVKTFHGNIHEPKSLPHELVDMQWDAVVNWIAFHEKDIERDYQLFKGKTKQYIFISSASVYQKPLLNPVITESTPLKNPFWEYSRNKIKCEEYLNLLYRDFDFPITIVRPSLTYDTVIPVAIGGFNEYTTCQRILNDQQIIVHDDGQSLWTITHSRDFAKGFIGLLCNPKTIGHAFHITSDEVLTWNSIYETLASALGRKPNMIHIPAEFICKTFDSYTGTLLGDKAVSTMFDNSKIKSFVPGFQATIPFREGIRETLTWFDEHPEKKIVPKETNDKIEKIIQSFKIQ